jgi:hypothetical protein
MISPPDEARTSLLGCKPGLNVADERTKARAFFEPREYPAFLIKGTCGVDCLYYDNNRRAEEGITSTGVSKGDGSGDPKRKRSNVAIAPSL